MGTVKVKYRDTWVEPDDIPDLRAAEREAVRSPSVDVAALPRGGDLDEMGVAYPAVRHYINAKGEIRSGLTPDEEVVARQILVRHYINAQGEIRSDLTPDEEAVARRILEQCKKETQ